MAGPGTRRIGKKRAARLARRQPSRSTPLVQVRALSALIAEHTIPWAEYERRWNERIARELQRGVRVVTLGSSGLI